MNAGRVENEKTRVAVAGNHITRAYRRPSNCIVGLRDQYSSVIAEGGGACGIGPDQVALHYISSRTNLDADAVGGDDVARPRLRTANFIRERIRFNTDSSVIEDCVGACGVGPDQVALHAIAARITAGNPDAPVMAGDEISCACHGPANQIAGAIRNLHAKEMIARSAVAGGIGADEGIFDHIVAGL